MLRKIAALTLAPLAALSSAAIFAACSSTSDATPGSDAGGDAPTDAGRETGASTDTGAADAGTSICQKKKSYLEVCGFPLDCGENFLDVCAANVKLDSALSQAAEIACTTADNCGSKKKDDCKYKRYPGNALTAAQQDLLDRYCALCGKTNVAQCKIDALAYGGDPAIVSDIFLAVWESSDTLAKSMADKCTGTAADAGTDAGAVTCERGFALCAGGVYIDALTACP